MNIIREFINRAAERKGCADAIVNLSDLNAIRFIQNREGFSSCFGLDVPLRPHSEDPSRCTEERCYWRAYCNFYRSASIMPIEKVFPHDNRETIEQFSRFLRSQAKDQYTALPHGAVGLKIRSMDRTDLDSITRKMLLATPCTIVAESTQTLTSLKPFLIAYKYMPYSTGYSKMYYAKLSWETILTTDIVALRNWLEETRTFIENGNLGYWPLLNSMETERQIWVTEGGIDLPKVPLPESLNLETFDTPHLGVPSGDFMLTNPDFAPLFQIEIPLLDNIDFRVLFELMNSYPNELCSFRDFLHPELENIRNAAVGSEEFGRKCQQLEREIRGQLRKLESDYKKARIRAAFEITGCAVASWTLAIYCILNGHNNILTVLGPGGITYKASVSYSDYLVRLYEMRENPAYLLWVIRRTKGHNH